MRLAVIGKSGQVATALTSAKLPSADWKVVSLGRPALDITDRSAVQAAIAELAPDIVVNAAAYTAVDKAETEVDAAFAVNRDGAGFIAEATAAHDIPLIHISTDYVFAGDADQPYRETDPVGPVGVYGQSKLAGEELVAARNQRHIILRTAWVHSPWGGNFVKTMLRLGAERDTLRIVADQTGTPTYAPDLADGIIALAARIAALPADSEKWGTYHLTNSGQATWFDLAGRIFEVVRGLGDPAPELEPITTDAYPTPARRPAWSVLSNDKIAAAFGVRLRDWEAGVDDCVRRLLAS